jgi:short subunit dehydrogenase-like uncharacterized protein
LAADRELEITVFGATGFVGRLVAAYLAGHSPDGVRVGLAGRSQEKLARVRAELPARAGLATSFPGLSATRGG